MTHDAKLAELARLFLADAAQPDDPRLDAAAADLADDMQDAVEDFLRVRLCGECQAIMSARDAIHDNCPRCRGTESA